MKPSLNFPSKVKTGLRAVAAAGLFAAAPSALANDANPFATPQAGSAERYEECVRPSDQKKFTANLYLALISQQRKAVEKAQNASNSLSAMGDTSGKSPTEIIAMQEPVSDAVKLASTLSTLQYTLSTMRSDYNNAYGRFCGLGLSKINE